MICKGYYTPFPYKSYLNPFSNTYQLGLTLLWLNRRDSKLSNIHLQNLIPFDKINFKLSAIL